MNKQLICCLSKTRWYMSLVLAMSCLALVQQAFGDEVRKVPDSSWTKNGEVSFSDGIDDAIRRDAYRERGLVAEPEQVKAPPAAPTPRSFSTGPWEWTTIFMYLIMGLVVVIVIACLIYFFREGWFFLPRRDKKTKNRLAIPEAKLMDLPFQMETPLQGLLEEAKAAFARGDFNAAIVFLYAHILVELDGARLIHLQRGKTNGMYARELRPHIQLRQIVVRVVGVFELAFFGKYKIQREQFIECWNSLEEFNKLLKGHEQEMNAVAKSASQASIASGVGT